MEKLRFVSSGTEATMSAIRLARAFTGRKYVIKFEGCYHGHSDGLLVKAGSGVATFGIPGSAGVPEEIAHLTLALPFNDLGGGRGGLRDRIQGEIACVIVEPVVGNAGCIPPAEGYLEALRRDHGARGRGADLRRGDDGFRLALGGAQELYGITPDMTTLGKIVGGGLPCAAFGGRAEIMNMLAPLGPVYQAGTLSGNPLAMAAGIATVGHLIEHRDSVYPLLERLSAAVADGVAAEAVEGRRGDDDQSRGRDVDVVLHGGPVTDFAAAATSDTAAFGRFHRAMLEQGVWLPPSQYEAVFLGTAHTMDDMKQTVSAAEEVFASHPSRQTAS